MTVEKSFTAAGASDQLSLGPGQSLTYAIAGTYTGFVIVERSNSPLSFWDTVRRGTTGLAFTGGLKNETQGPLWVRLRAEGPMTGEAECVLEDVDDVVAEIKDSQGRVVAQFTDDGLSGAGSGEDGAPGAPGAAGAAGATGPAGAAGAAATNYIKMFRRVFSDAEVKAFPTTGEFELIPAVAGKIYVPMVVFIEIRPFAVHYDNVDGAGRIRIYTYDSPTFRWFDVVAQYVIDGASNPLATVRGDALAGFDGFIIDGSNYAGVSVKMRVTNAAAGDFTAGDSSNKMVVTAYYVELLTGTTP